MDTDSERTTPVTVGIAGHGLLISPYCPCRVVHQHNGVLLVATLLRVDDARAAFSLIGSIKPGSAPATHDAERIDETTWRFGAGGPEIKLPVGGPRDLAAAFAQIDAGLGEAPWQLLAPGCWLGFPPGFTMTSPLDDEPFFELHLNDGPRSIPDAIIQFQARAIAAGEVQLRGTFAVEESILDDDIRVWTYGYDVDGVPWRKRHYALPLAADQTILMSAQAPAEHADAMFTGADACAIEFGPLG